jgi:hypothetical protein
MISPVNQKWGCSPAVPEVGEILQSFMPKLQNHISNIAQQQYDKCMEKGFDLKKYYVWILYYKSNKEGKLVFRPAICRSTRPSPYQDEDMLLWSVTNYDHIDFEYAIPKKETLNYILANPDKFEKNHVEMLRKYVQDKIEKVEDYLVDGVIK